MQRFKCKCAYDGTAFRGWQTQASNDSIQDFIERRLFKIFRKTTRIHSSGRTDAGVHAMCQVFHFDADWSHSEEDLQKALRNGYPEAIQILSVKKCSSKFQARFDAKSKEYVYKIYLGRALPHLTRYRWSMFNRKLDVEKMKDACEIFLGTHDFKAYSANRGKDVKEDTIKTIYKLEIKKSGKELTISTRGSGYLYKMVRMIVGALVDVGIGKSSKEELKKMLESKTRNNTTQSAPAKGLFLNKVYYK